MNSEINLNSNKVVIVSQALHHLEKSIFLKENVFKDALIINCYLNKDKLSSIKNQFYDQNIKHFSSVLDINLSNFENNRIFIFLSFSPSLDLINFIYKLKQRNKKIVLIQDNHQFSLHKGSANSALLKPDLLFAASDLEKKYIEERKLLPPSKIISNGWVFQNSFYDSFLEANLEAKIKLSKRILIAFSAPSGLTLTSRETYASRKKIMLWIGKHFPSFMIVIKLHPHENSEIFKSYFSDTKITFELLPSQSSIINAIRDSEIVVSSNETQIPLDVISYDVRKKLLVYFYKKENFLNEKISILSTEDFGNNSDVHIGSLDLPARREIAKTHLRFENNMYDFLSKSIVRISTDGLLQDPPLDILLWLYVHGRTGYIFEFLQSEKSEKYKNLYNLLSNKEYDLEKIHQSFQNSSTRDPLSIILIRECVLNKRISKKHLDFITQYFIKEYLLQFFFKDTLRLSNLISANQLNTSFNTNYRYLIKNIEKLYITKFRFIAIFFLILKRVYSLDIKWLSKIFLSLSDRIFKY